MCLKLEHTAVTQQVHVPETKAHRHHKKNPAAQADPRARNWDALPSQEKPNRCTSLKLEHTAITRKTLQVRVPETEAHTVTGEPQQVHMPETGAHAITGEIQHVHVPETGGHHRKMREPACASA